MVQAAPFILQVEFQHDLEDGWYAVKMPNGEVHHYNRANSITELASKNGWNIEYIGNEWYNPFK